MGYSVGTCKSVERNADDGGLACEIIVGSKDLIRAICVKYLNYKSVIPG